MRYLILCILFVTANIYTLSLSAQSRVISGKVFDKRTQQIIPFAGICMSGTTFGTVANENGEFELHLPTSVSPRDSLAVSSIGYERATFCISDIKTPQKFNIYLAPAAYFLAEIPILASRLSAEELVRKAIEQIPKNYIAEPFMMDGFYREYFKENGNFVALAESSVSIYDGIGYNRVKEKSNKTKETVALNEIRVSDINNKGNYVLYIDINYALRSNIVRNIDYWKKYLERGNYEVQKLAIDSITYDHRDTVFCIGYKLSSRKYGSYEGRLFIRTGDYALLRFEVNALNFLKNREENGAPHQSHAVFNYQEYKGKMYLNYINASHDVLFTENEQLYKLAFFSELQISNVQTRNVTPIPPGQVMDEKSIFYQPRYRTYNPEYWQSYNLFEDSDANDSIIADLERQRALEIQYRANGKLKINMNTPTYPLDGANTINER